MVIGSSGGIGSAVLQGYLQDAHFTQVIAVSRVQRPDDIAYHDDRLCWICSDCSEKSIASVTDTLAQIKIELRHIVICNGILHNQLLHSHVISEDELPLFEFFCNGITERGRVAITAAQCQLQLFRPQAKAEQGIIAVDATFINTSGICLCSLDSGGVRHTG